MATRWTDAPTFDRVGLAGMLEFRPTPFKPEESEP